MGLISLDELVRCRLYSYAELGIVSDFLSVATSKFPNFDLSFLGNEDTHFALDDLICFSIFSTSFSIFILPVKDPNMSSFSI